MRDIVSINDKLRRLDCCYEVQDTGESSWVDGRGLKTEGKEIGEWFCACARRKGSGRILIYARQKE